MRAGEHSIDSFSLTAGQLVEEAVSIAEQIVERAVHMPSGIINWLTYSYDRQLGRRRRQWMGPDFYDGVCGTALFLAAVSRVTGRLDFREMTVSVLEGIARMVQTNPRTFFTHGIGGARGASSVIYVLAKAAALLEDTAFLYPALSLARHITPADIENDDTLDLLSGSAGCAIGLLSLSEALPGHGWLMEKAEACGEHLLRKRRPAPGGFAVWRVYGQFMSGLAHGCAGISYALSRLYLATGQPALLDAAMDGCGFEDRLYCDDQLNWKKSAESSQLFNRWCHGAAGIGLSRLGALRAMDCSQVRKDIERAITSLRSALSTELDYPCCGNLGAMECFLVADEMGYCHSARKHAQKIAEFVVGRARKRNTYALEPDEREFNPSFHQGMAGIGYQLLRLVAGNTLPSALLWE